MVDGLKHLEFTKWWLHAGTGVTKMRTKKPE